MDYETKNLSATLVQVALKFFLKFSISAVHKTIPQKNSRN